MITISQHGIQSILKILPIFAMTLLQSGCGGNQSPNKSDELPIGCLVKPDPGSCRAAQTKFYYDYRDDQCKPFTYNGCHGRIPFQTLQDCREQCIAGG